MLPQGLSFYISVNFSQMATFGQWGLCWTGQGQPCWKENKDTKEQRENSGICSSGRGEHSTQRASKEKLKGQKGGSKLGKIPSSGLWLALQPSLRLICRFRVTCIRKPGFQNIRAGWCNVPAGWAVAMLVLMSPSCFSPTCFYAPPLSLPIW